MNWELIATSLGLLGTVTLAILYGLALSGKAKAEAQFIRAQTSLDTAKAQLKTTQQLLEKRNEYVRALETKVVDSVGPDGLVDMFNHLLLPNSESTDDN